MTFHHVIGLNYSPTCCLVGFTTWFSTRAVSMDLAHKGGSRRGGGIHGPKLGRPEPEPSWGPYIDIGLNLEARRQGI